MCSVMAEILLILYTSRYAIYKTLENSPKKKSALIG